MEVKEGMRRDTAATIQLLLVVVVLLATLVH